MNAGTPTQQPRRGSKVRASILATFWAVIAIVGALGASEIENTLGDVGWAPQGAQSEIVAEGLEDGFVGNGLTSLTAVVTDNEATADDPDFQARTAEVANFINDDLNLDISSWIGYTNAGDARDAYLGDDQRTTLIQLGSSLDGDALADRVTDAQKTLSDRFGDSGITVELVGTQPFLTEMSTASMEGLARAELIAFPLIIIVLLILYRSVAATLVSLVATGTTIVLTLGIVNWIGTHWFDMSEFTLNSVTMLGLGICVDYTLFIIRRFQTELAAGHDPRTALRTTMRTSGEAVIASGLTVAVAMSVLFFIDSAVIRSIATGVVIVVLLSVLASTVFVPALLTLLGARINWARIPKIGRRRATENPRPNAATRVSQRYPWGVIVAAVAVLGALIIPISHIQVGSADASIARDDAPVRQGFETIKDQFSLGTTAPIQILIATEEGGIASLDDRQVRDLVEHLEDSDHVETVTHPLDALAQLVPADPLSAADPDVLAELPDEAQLTIGTMVSDDGQRLLITVLPRGSATSEDARDALFDARAAVDDVQIDGAAVNVGGETQINEEATEVIAESLPAVIAIMLVVILILMVITFRSIVIPLLTVVLNVLSVGATVGIMVLVFQDGFAAHLLGFTQLGHLINWVPVLLIALLVSLATDYQVFILTRIREYMRDSSLATRQAIATGMRETGPLITGAAFLMVVVFGAFAFTGVVPIQQFGFGLAIGVAIDATIVRMLLVPACLTVLGRSAWWPGIRRSTPQSGTETPAQRIEEPAPR